MLRILWHVGRPLRASELFGRIERSVPGPNFPDVSSFAAEALQLERRGFVLHALDASGFVTLSLTPRGRRFIGLRYGAYKRPLAASLMAPVVVACTSVPPSQHGIAKPHSVAQQAQLPPKPGAVLHYTGTGGARQVLINGKKTWLWCTSNDCVYPTAKQEAPAQVPEARAAPEGASSPTRANTTAVAALERVQRSVFFGFGAASLRGADASKLRDLVKGVDRKKRVTVTGVTDHSGPASVNEQLARRRAEAVKAVLVNEGFAEASITVTTDVSGTLEPPETTETTPSMQPRGDGRFRRADVQFEREGQANSPRTSKAPKAAVVAIPTLDSLRASASKALTSCAADKADFNVPAGIRPKMHVARFEVMVGPGGQQVARATMVQSSGLPSFDAAVARAVERCLEGGAAKDLKVSAALPTELDLFGLSLRERIASTEIMDGGPAAEKNRR